MWLMRLIDIILCKHKDARIIESGIHFYNGGTTKCVFERYLCPVCGAMWDEEEEIV